MPSSTRPHAPRTSSSSARSSSTRVHRTEIIINVYDLLPPSKVSSLLWPLGLSLLHTGIVLDDREYSYGATPDDANSPPDQTGVFWTRPRLEPPGATFRCSILQGITFLSKAEIDALVRDVSARFPGPAYNLLNNNCNHFTSHMCRALTQREAPAWINRASRVGMFLPCLVPAAWLEPPDAEFGEGSGGSDEEADEASEMMPGKHAGRPSLDARRSTDSRRESLRMKDTSGRALPSSEQAPIDRLV